MRTINFLLICLFSILIFNSSFMCIRLQKVVSIDSIQYFKPKNIRLNQDNFKISQLQLQLRDGLHTFVKDTIRNHSYFKAEKDEENIYIIFTMSTTSIEKTYLTASIDYQSFDKKREFNTSKIYHLKNVQIPFTDLKSFTVRYQEYEKVFGIKRNSK